MNNATIIAAAACLDDIASGTLNHGDFYKALHNAGNLSGDLCVMVLRDQLNNEANPSSTVIMAAAECLKDLCIDTNLPRYMRAVQSAKIHSENLYRITDKRSA